MKLTAANSITFFKLPAAFIWSAELRRESLYRKVKHRWINQNPFNSMYFAVQAWELSWLLALVMYQPKK
jgi:hypothetical protein